jgi:hypothetical protein
MINFVSLHIKILNRTPCKKNLSAANSLGLMEPRQSQSAILRQASETIKKICDQMYEKGIERHKIKYKPSKKETRELAKKAIEVASKYYMKVPNHQRPSTIAMASIVAAGVMLRKDYISGRSVVYTAYKSGINANVSTFGAVDELFGEIREKVYPKIVKVGRGEYEFSGRRSKSRSTGSK